MTKMKVGTSLKKFWSKIILFSQIDGFEALKTFQDVSMFFDYLKIFGIGFCTKILIQNKRAISDNCGR